MEDIALSNSLGVAMLVTFLIQKMKGSGLRVFNWVSSTNPWMVRLIGAVGAALTAAGFSWEYSGDELTIAGLTATNAIAFLWVMAKQYLFQEGMYSVKKAAGRWGTGS